MAHVHNEPVRPHNLPRFDTSDRQHGGRRSREHSPTHTARQSFPSEKAHRNPRRSYQYPPPSFIPQTSRHLSWPPSPFLEEEKTSLAREVNPPRLTDSDVSDVCSRGSLDQQPIILDASEPLVKTNAFPARHGGSRPSPRDYDSDRSCSSSDNGSHFTMGSREREKTASVDSGYFSSAEAKAHALAGKNRAGYSQKDMPTSDALRGKGKSRGSFDNFQRQHSVGSSDNGSEKCSSNTSDAERTSTRSGIATQDFSQSDTRPYLKEAINGPASRFAELKADALNATRRSSDSETTLPRPRLAEDARKTSSRRPPPLASVGTKTGTTAPSSRTNSDRGSGSRPGSPVSATTPRMSMGSPSSSRQGSFCDPQQSPVPGRTSASSSRPGSRAGSRPSSPTWPQQAMLFDAVRRSSTFPAVPEDRTQRTSRLVSSESASDSNSFSPPALRTSATAPVMASGGLPYPVDDMNLMPSEEDHRYKPRPLSVDPVSSIPAHRDIPSGPGSKREQPTRATTARPPLASRHSHGDNVPGVAAATAAMLAAPKAMSPLTDSKNLAGRLKRRIEDCPRPHASRDHDDWYTLEKEPSFHMCPTCYKSNFVSGPYQKLCKRAPVKDNKARIKCEFNSQWTRLAMLLTLEQHRHDLDLLYKMARINASTHTCPGDHSDARTWHTVVDRQGNAIDGFDVCTADVKRVEALLPELRGMFQSAYNGVTKKRKCDVRERSKRFKEYLDVLIDLDEQAYDKKKPADLEKFVELARQKTQYRECEEDTMLLDVAWHTAPQLPEFTVCEECYVSVIWPAIKVGSSVASRFNRTPQLVYDKGERRRASYGGNTSSCQLYSPRMRRVFHKAVQTGDFSLLAHEARERKDVELRLHERLSALQKQQYDLEKQGDSSAAIKSERKRWMQEWRKVE